MTTCTFFFFSGPDCSQPGHPGGVSPTPTNAAGGDSLSRSYRSSP